MRRFIDLSEKFHHGFVPTYNRGKPCEVFKNPDRSEVRKLKADMDEVRAYLVGDDIFMWNTYQSLHRTVHDELKLPADALPIIIYGDVDDEASVVVTDASRSTVWHHNAETRGAIMAHPYFARCEDVEVSYYDEAIVGQWHDPKGENEDFVAHFMGDEYGDDSIDHGAEDPDDDGFTDEERALHEGMALNLFELSGPSQEAANQKFAAYAKSQRNGKPELFGTSQRANPGLFHGTGYFTWMCEHVGDLSHRIADNAVNSTCGFETMNEKVGKALDKLRSGSFGRTFARTVVENVRNNYHYGVEVGRTTGSFEEFETEWRDASKLYGAAHAALQPFNDAQMHCRDAAVALGNHDWLKCLKHLEVLAAHLVDRESWQAYAGALAFTQNESFRGRLPFDPEDAVTNPSAKRLMAMVKNATHQDLRGLYDGTNLYFWDASLGVHSHVAPAIGLEYDYLKRLNVDIVYGGVEITWDEGVPKEAIAKRYGDLGRFKTAQTFEFEGALS
jgi:hypothetical protein